MNPHGAKMCMAKCRCPILSLLDLRGLGRLCNFQYPVEKSTMGTAMQGMLKVSTQVYLPDVKGNIMKMTW